MTKRGKWIRNILIGAAVLGSAAAIAKPLMSGTHLKVGDPAPRFETQGAMAGKVFAYSLSDAVKRGPVVLYFFPKAFTKGCTAETAAFAQMMDRFTAAGASVVGLSADPLPALQRFSTEVCASKFPVVQATPQIIESYGVKLPAVAMTNRTSFVIGRDGRIAYIYSDMNHVHHVRNSLAAVERLKR